MLIDALIDAVLCGLLPVSHVNHELIISDHTSAVGTPHVGRFQLIEGRKWKVRDKTCRERAWARMWLKTNVGWPRVIPHTTLVRERINLGGVELPVSQV